MVQALNKSGQIKSVVSSDEKSRVEALKELLDYPIIQRDPQGSRFWYLRPGVNEEKAEETCPIAVGFYSEFNNATEREIQDFLTAKDPQSEIYRHYIGRAGYVVNQPVMYLLLPEATEQGKVVFVLPTEGGIRQRQIKIFAWNDRELSGRLERLKQANLKIASREIAEIPLIDWVFYPGVKTARKLAQLMADIARDIERVVPTVAQNQGKSGYLYELFLSFKKELLPTLQLKADDDKDYSFADIYAQTIAYGLFTARVFSYIKFKQYQTKHPGYDIEPDFYRDNAWESLPPTNPFLRKLFKDISEQKPETLGEELVGSVSELLSVLRAVEMEAVLSDFQQKVGQEDIIIRFYEDFLAAYKPQMRERRGVYYTPEPVVSYMVRSVDELLKDKFNKPLGIADPEVTILDPACGTGTFLLWIFQLIHKRFQESPELLTEGLEDKTWSRYVRERLLPRIFGFELLMSPYAICHLKLGLFLEETGYQFDSGKRLGVYLTNTLENSVRKSETFFDEFIAQEAEQATEIKRDKQIMVVVGNPPYSISSANKGKFIEGLMERYKKSVRSERNIQPLSDDYIKFLSLAHHQIEKTGYGIISLITNHSYISGLVHRGVREELYKTFDEIKVLDLHGNSTINETPPYDVKDNNVFQIKQGVGITFAIKKERIKNNKSNDKIFHYDLWGAKEEKQKFLSNFHIFSTKWSELKPTYPNYFFVPKDFRLLDEYKTYFNLSDVFRIGSCGLETGKDRILISFDKNSIKKFIKEILDPCITENEIEKKYNIRDTSGWRFSRGRSLLIEEGLQNSLVVPVSYRPFDKRFIYYSKILRRMQQQVLQHLRKKNLGILLCRQQAEKGFYHVFCTDKIVERCAVSLATKEVTYVYPLYLYNDINILGQSILEENRYSNLSQNFLNKISKKLNYLPTPEAIFYYIYAILHSPTYRDRYAEFLKIDFPRIPLTSNDELFRQLADYGEQLVQLHLMTSPKLDNLITEFVEGEGDLAPRASKADRTVNIGSAKKAYSNGTVKLNKKGDRFTGVPESVWNFYVGGYQVCHKWLKDRKGRTLSDEDILHYQKIVVALKETTKLMTKIDEAIPGFPIQ